MATPTTATNASSGANTDRPVLGARTSSRIAANQVLDYCAEKLHLDAGADKSRGRKDSTLEGGDATTPGEGGVDLQQQQNKQEKRRSGGRGFDNPKVMFGMSNDV